MMAETCKCRRPASLAHSLTSCPGPVPLQAVCLCAEPCHRGVCACMFATVVQSSCQGKLGWVTSVSLLLLPLHRAVVLFLPRVACRLYSVARRLFLPPPSLVMRVRALGRVLGPCCRAASPQPPCSTGEPPLCSAPYTPAVQQPLRGASSISVHAMARRACPSVPR